MTSLGQKFFFPPFDFTPNSLLDVAKLRGVQKTDEPNKLAETDRTVAKFSVRFSFGFEFLKPKIFSSVFYLGFECTEPTEPNRTESYYNIFYI